MHIVRYLVGNSSPTTTQITGPQVMAYPAMNRHANTIKATPACGVFSGCSMSSAKWPTEAKTMKHMNIHVAPYMRALRRPSFSTTMRIPGNVLYRSSEFVLHSLLRRFHLHDEVYSSKNHGCDVGLNSDGFKDSCSKVEDCESQSHSFYFQW